MLVYIDLICPGITFGLNVDRAAPLTVVAAAAAAAAAVAEAAAAGKGTAAAITVAYVAAATGVTALGIITAPEPRRC